MIAIEAAEGSDAMIARSATLLDPDGGVACFVKMAKSAQDLRLDVPVFGGERTVRSAAIAGLSLLAVEAETVLLADDLASIRTTCASHKITLIGIEREEQAMTSPIFILAGEPSGDQLAAHIMRAINHHYQSPLWIGVGGALMQDEGLSSLVDIETMSIMGFGNAILAYQRLSVLADKLVEQVISAQPKIVLTIDNKGFSIRFAMRLRRRMKAVGWSAPIIHCVAPTVWAWGRWRAKKFANTLDGLLCLFPFEPEYFRHSHLDAHFIGHPEAFKNYQPKKWAKREEIRVTPDRLTTRKPSVRN